MRFILTKNSNLVLQTINYNKILVGDYYLFYNNNNNDKSSIIEFKYNKVYIIGDCVNRNIINDSNVWLNDTIFQLKGNFILIIIQGYRFKIFSSCFGLLPVYYSDNFNSISNNFELICDQININNKFNKKFILESFLFNYSFSNQTYLNQVKLLENFSYIEYNNGKFEVKKYLDIKEWFTEKPENGKKQLSNLASLFLNQIQYYYSEGINSITFTSGFDGRTILSAATLHNVKFETFSFGRSQNPDVTVPLQNSKILNIPYHFYDLGNQEYQNVYFDIATKMSKITGGFNGFLYAHFLYGVINEKSYSNTLLTGYCGSELFRAMHIQGAVTSKELVSIFTETDDLKLKDILWNSPKLAFIKKSEYINEFEDLFAEILEFRKTKDNYISNNHFFYSYIFNEVFRKVFGALTVAQMEEMNIRTPFLDYDFITALLRTDLAGCNNEFFTHNPLKRLKGQMLYAEVIRQSNIKLYTLKTGKGYRPIDLLTPHGKFKILYPYFKKQFIRKFQRPYLDNLGIISAYQYNKYKIDKLYQKLEGFEISKIIEASNKLNSYTPEEERDILLQTASMASLL